MNEKFKIWLRATRPFAFTGSAVPVIIGSVLAISEHKFHFGYFVVALVAIVALQAGANLINDYYDFKSNVDTKDSLGSSGVIVQNLMSPEKIKRGGIISLAIGSLLGLYLSYERGWIILLFGLIGALGAYFYTAKPLALKYKGLGVPMVFLLFGPLPVLGAYYVQTMSMNLTALLVSIPLGLLTTAILHANDIRDIASDKKAGIKTLAIISGRENAKKIYHFLVLFAYVSILLMVFYNFIPYWSLICFITLPDTIKNIKKLNLSSDNVSDIKTLDVETAQLQTKFGVIFILSILLTSIIK